MKQKELTFNEAGKVWWAWGWRTAIASIIVNVVLLYGVSQFSIQTFGAERYTAFILNIVAAVYFFKIVVNKDYGNFRVIAIEKNSEIS